MKEGEVGSACSMHGRDEMHSKFLSENLKGRDQLENLLVNGRIILK
jgi:hypothetical protein